MLIHLWIPLNNSNNRSSYFFLHLFLCLVFQFPYSPLPLRIHFLPLILSFFYLNSYFLTTYYHIFEFLHKLLSTYLSTTLFHILFLRVPFISDPFIWTPSPHPSFFSPLSLFHLSPSYLHLLYFTFPYPASPPLLHLSYHHCPLLTAPFKLAEICIGWWTVSLQCRRHEAGWA